MRGKVNRRMVAAILGGITPAYAGKRRFTILHELGH